jgi:hypothetical protein
VDILFGYGLPKYAIMKRTRTVHSRTIFLGLLVVISDMEKERKKGAKPFNDSSISLSRG